ncbi:hypothetical protein ACFX1T_007567 [Malus domestica]
MIGMKEQRPPIVPNDVSEMYQRRKDNNSRGWTRVPPRIAAQLTVATPPDTTTSTTPMAIAITPSSSPALLLFCFRSTVQS